MGADFGARGELPLIRVDDDGHETGTVTLREAHTLPGVLHRAFSAYLFDGDGRLLVHERAPEKPLWAGHWTNSCCSHPRAGQGLAEAVTVRIQEELGAAGVVCEERFGYVYRAEFEGRGVEHEYVHVMVGTVEPGALDPDPAEVAAHRFLGPDEVDALIASDTPTTPWFELAWARLRRDGVT